MGADFGFLSVQLSPPPAKIADAAVPVIEPDCPDVWLKICPVNDTSGPSTVNLMWNEYDCDTWPPGGTAEFIEACSVPDIMPVDNPQ